MIRPHDAQVLAVIASATAPMTAADIAMRLWPASLGGNAAARRAFLHLRRAGLVAAYEPERPEGMFVRGAATAYGLTPDGAAVLDRLGHDPLGCAGPYRGCRACRALWLGERVALARGAR